MKRIREKIQSIPREMKASVAFFGASVVASGINYITTPIYTRLLTADEYGHISFFMTWVGLFEILATFYLSGGVFNNGMVDYPDRRNEFSLSMLILSNVITICFFLVLLLLYPLIKSLIGLELPLIILMVVLFLFQPAYKFWVGRQRYELKYKWTSFWSVLSSVLSPVVAVFCILIFKDNRLYARIFGAELPLIITYIGFYIYLVKKGRCDVQTKYWKEALLFNLPLIPHYLSSYLLGSSDKIMISRLVSDSATAYYSVAYAISSVAIIIWTAANGSFIPYTYEKCSKKDYQSVSAVAMMILTVFAAACMGIIMLAPEVVAIVATQDYREAIYAIPPIIGGVFFQVHYGLYGNILFFYKKTKYITLATVVSTGLNIILNYIFIQRYGYIAAGYTTLICYLIQALLDYIVMRKIIGESVYNMKYIGILSFGVIAVSLLSNFIYDYVVIRYAVITIILFICFLFRKRIIRIFKSMKLRKEA